MPMSVSQLLWGTNFENVVNLGWPLDRVVTGSLPRAGSEFVRGMSGIEDSWITEVDYYLSGLARWFPAMDVAGPVQTGWTGSRGMRAFLEYARAKNTFRFVPNQANPLFFVDGCYLVDPVDTKTLPVLEPDGSQQLQVLMRNPMLDFGLAMRGLMFEYQPGADISSFGLNGTFTQAGQRAYFGKDGLVHFAPANTLRDRHYPSGPNGPRATLREPAHTNSVLQSQAWATSPWTVNVVTPTNNAAVAPDGTTTATKLLPNNTGASNNPWVMSGGVTITSGEFVAASWYVKANGYSGVVLRFMDSATTNGIQVSFDLAAGAFGTAHSGFGAGVLSGFASVPLANGWYWVGAWGSINGGITSAVIQCLVYPTITQANGNTAYTADGVSSVLGWGGQLERNGTELAIPRSYVPTTTVTVTATADSWTFPWPFLPQTVTVYAKLIEVGGQPSATGKNWGLLQIGDAGFVNPRMYLNRIGGSWSASESFPGAGTAALVEGARSYGATVEICATYGAGANTVQLFEAINGGAFTVGSAVNGAVFPAAWNAAILTLAAFDIGAYAIQSLKVAAGIYTPAQMQVL